VDAAAGGEGGGSQASEEPPIVDPPFADFGPPSEAAQTPQGIVVPAGRCSTPGLGLYRDGYCDERHLASGVYRYEPKFPLWSDGAAKFRYIKLPDDFPSDSSFIDTANPDRWAFPKGTQLWKMFVIDGLRVETRKLTKTGDGVGAAAWTFEVFIWSEEQNSTTLWDTSNADPKLQGAVQNVLGTDHNIPSKADCLSCHTKLKFRGPGEDATTPATHEADPVNGFSAIQLNWDNAPEERGRPSPLTLDKLLFNKWIQNGPNGLDNVSEDRARIPGDEKALGYLHANCGHCHGGDAPTANLSLWAKIGVRMPRKMPAFETACGQCLQKWIGHPNPEIEVARGVPDIFRYRMVPGQSDASAIVARMETLVPQDRMPKIGSDMIDSVGVQAVRDWIDSLDPHACDPDPGLPAPVCPTEPPAAPN
jgi:mono/diheme cytochrome c family protein